MSKSTYTVTFRGQHVETFTSVHAQGFLVLEYKITHHFGGTVSHAFRPRRAGFFKTEAYARKMVRDNSRYSGHMFAIPLSPGTTEIVLTESLVA